eukprot:gnl/MRDRNA2_/MRDRNA2_163047_c0_seq1.p1 gnl/MRDRNA2_/MRDRNA2_163047_c0~~gnl/MRDRNA2_/MRDRNA2_163047_c0_seq1.p1  ORF type:complete len:598 (+),score=86.84 gnl/MRDRNA2_/MRDRNA2_163047_c0_seq1:63-1856(+)
MQSTSSNFGVDYIDNSEDLEAWGSQGSCQKGQPARKRNVKRIIRTLWCLVLVGIVLSILLFCLNQWLAAVHEVDMQVVNFMGRLRLLIQNMGMVLMVQRLTTDNASQYFVYPGRDSCKLIGNIQTELLGMKTGEDLEGDQAPEIYDDHVKTLLSSWGEEAQSLCNLRFQGANLEIPLLLRKVNQITNSMDLIVDEAAISADRRAMALGLLSISRAVVGVFIAMCTAMSTKKVYSLYVQEFNVVQEESENAKAVYKQVSRMLGAMCDAAVTMDSSFMITGGHDNGLAKLNSLLLLPRATVHRKPIIDYTSAKDRDRFRSYLGAEALHAGTCDPNVASPIVPSIHLDLVDKWGQMVPVQLFCISFLDDSNALFYLLGIQMDIESDGGNFHQSVQAPRGAEVSIQSSGFQVAAIEMENKVNSRKADDIFSLQHITSSYSGSGSSNSADEQFGIDLDREIESKFLNRIGFCCVPTPTETVDRSLRRLVKAINGDESNLRATKCCLWHLGLWTLECSLKKLKKGGCKKEFEPYYSQQCSSCYMMNDSRQAYCKFCCKPFTNFGDLAPFSFESDGEDEQEIPSSAIDKTEARSPHTIGKATSL